MDMKTHFFALRRNYETAEQRLVIASDPLMAGSVAIPSLNHFKMMQGTDCFVPA